MFTIFSYFSAFLREFSGLQLEGQGQGQGRAGVTVEHRLTEVLQSPPRAPKFSGAMVTQWSMKVFFNLTDPRSLSLFRCPS